MATKITVNSLADSAVTSAKIANTISVGTLSVSGNTTIPSIIGNTSFSNNAGVLGTLTVNGQTLLNGQVSTAAASAMTRNTTLAEEAFNVAYYGFGQNTSGGNSGTSSSSIRSGSTASGFGRNIITSTVMRTEASGGLQILANARIAVSIFGSADVQSATNGAVVRLIVGDNGNAVGVPPRFADQNALIARGFGAEIFFSSANNRQEIRLFAHDGTNYVTSTGVAFPNTYTGSHTIMVSTDGLGTIKLFASSTGSSFVFPPRPELLATLSGGPSGVNTFGGNHITVVCVNHSTIAPTAGDAFFAMARSKFVIGAII